MPSNRFALKSIKKDWLIIAAAILLIIIYFGFNLKRLLGQPTLIITTPSSETTVTNYPVINISGQINKSDILKINGQELTVDKYGKFEKLYNLQPGINNFEFSVKRMLGKELKVVRQVIYQP